jgi:hypothetical protein
MMSERDLEAFEEWFYKECCNPRQKRLAMHGWQAALAHRDAQLAEVTRQRDELAEAAKAAAVELSYLIEQVKAKPGGSVCRAEGNLDRALAHIQSEQQPKEPSDV